MAGSGIEEGSLEARRGRPYKSCQWPELYFLEIILLLYANDGNEVQKE